MDTNFSPEEFNRFIGRLPEESDGDDTISEYDVMSMLRRAIGSSTALCESCGGICQHQTIQLRDSFMRRARELGQQLVHGVNLYEESREFNIDEPDAIIEKIYEHWCELWVLYRFVEPQDRLVEIEEEGASPLEE